MERRHVGPEVGLRDPHFPVPYSDHGLLAEGAPQVVERLAQRVPGAGVVQIGPEDREERLPPFEAARPRRRRVGQPRGSLRLRQDRNDPGAVRAFPASPWSFRAGRSDLTRFFHPGRRPGPASWGARGEGSWQPSSPWWTPCSSACSPTRGPEESTPSGPASRADAPWASRRIAAWVSRLR